MITEQKEKQVLLLSFFSGLLFAIAEFIFSIYSHSQSALTDAVYDASELVFIALLLFLTPLFHKPVSEKHPYGYFQIESIFVIIKGTMMLAVTMGVSAQVIGSALSGGNPVDNTEISVFQFFLGIASAVIFFIMKRQNKNLASPTIKAELLGWKIDVIYSFGMSFAFFLSRYLEKTALSFTAPYFDQMVAVVVMAFTLPESLKILWAAIKDIFLFSPEETLVNEMKELCNPILEEYGFVPVFYDVTKTGRHLWIAIYFQIETESMYISDLESALKLVNQKSQEHYKECTCELILVPGQDSSIFNDDKGNHDKCDCK